MSNNKQAFFFLSIFVAFVLALGLIIVLLQISQAKAETLSNSYYIDGTNGTGTACTESNPCKTLTNALNLANSGDTLYLANAITETGQIVINNKVLTIKQWEGKGQAVLQKKDDTGISGPQRCWICLENNARVTIQGIQLSGKDQHVMEAIRVYTTTYLTLTETTLKDFRYGNTNSAPDTLGPIQGYAIYVEDGNLIVKDSYFSAFGRAAILACGGNVRVASSTFTGDGDENDSILNYGIVGGNSAKLRIGQSQFEDMKGNYAGGYKSAGIAVIRGSDFCESTAPSNAEITSTHLVSSTLGLLITEGLGDTSYVTAQGNRIYKSGVKVSNDNNSNILKYNWWGCNEGPAANSDCKGIEGLSSEAYSPWLTMTLQLSSQSAYLNDVITATAQIKSASYSIPDMTPVGFSGQGISFTSPNTTTKDGEAQASGIVDPASETVRIITATIDSEVVTRPLTVEQRKLALPLVLKDFSVWEMIHTDDFSSDPGSAKDPWKDIFGGTKFYHSYDTNQGKLLMTANDYNKFFLTLLDNSSQIITDTETQRYAIEATSFQEQNPYKYGLVIGYYEDQGNISFHAFRLYPETKSCEYRFFENNSWKTTVPISCDVVYRDNVKEYKIRLEFGGNSPVVFSVDGTQVFNNNDQLPKSNTKVGFIVAGGNSLPSIIAFDDFAIYRYRSY